MVFVGLLVLLALNNDLLVCHVVVDRYRPDRIHTLQNTPVQQGVVHCITTPGPFVHEWSHRLPPEHLQAAKQEFKHILYNVYILYVFYVCAGPCRC